MDLAEAEISSWMAEWTQRCPDKLVIRFEDRKIGYGANEAADGTACRRARPS